MTDSPDRDGSHDFDFQTGHWRIRNERLKKRLQGCAEWETFEATQEARLLPGGLGSTHKVLVFGKNVGTPKLRCVAYKERLT